MKIVHRQLSFFIRSSGKPFVLIPFFKSVCMLMTSDANLKQTLILKFVSNLFELVVRMDLFEANLVVLWHVKHLVLLLQ